MFRDAYVQNRHFLISITTKVFQHNKVVFLGSLGPCHKYMQNSMKNRMQHVSALRKVAHIAKRSIF